MYSSSIFNKFIANSFTFIFHLTAMKPFVNHISIWFILGALLLSPIFAESAKNRNSKKPNILVIMADGIGYGDLSVIGGADVQTPNIDELFNDGLIFTEFYANSAVGSPTHASLLSGNYPGRVGVQGEIRYDSDNSWGYFNSDSTLSTHFRESGYVTAMIGKWHLGLESPNLPNDKGFDLFIGYLGDQPNSIKTLQENGQSLMHYNDQEIESVGHPTDLFSDWSADFIERQADNQKPFFLFLAYNAPGSPIGPSNDWLEKVNNSRSFFDQNRAKNVACIEQMDAGVGKILNALKESSQLRNTIIIFSSDNGGSLHNGASNGIFRGGKHDLFEGGIRIPTCLFWKEKIKRRSLCHQIAMTMDLFPTLCDLSETPTNLKLDGESLASCIFKNEPFENERTLFWVCRDGGENQGKAYYAIRQGAYKLMQNTPFEDFKLFNLITDAHEQIPLRKSSEHYQRLDGLLTQHIQENERIPWKRETPSTKVTQSMNSE